MPARRTALQGRLVLVVVLGIGALLGVTYVQTRETNTREVTPEERAGRCIPQQFTCTSFPLPGSAFKPDGGRPPYTALIVAGLKCVTDAGVPFRALPVLDNEVLLDSNLCVETTDAGTTIEPQSTPLGEDILGCACKTGRDCFVKTPDGGFVAAPWAETLPYQGFAGTNCFPKVCGEFAGISSWPDECPREAPLLPDGGPAE